MMFIDSLDDGVAQLREWDQKNTWNTIQDQNWSIEVDDGVDEWEQDFADHKSMWQHFGVWG